MLSQAMAGTVAQPGCFRSAHLLKASNTLSGLSTARPCCRPQLKRAQLAVRASGGGQGGDGGSNPLSAGIAKGTQAVRELAKNVNPESKEDPKYAEMQPPYPVQQQDFPGEEHKMDPKPDYGYDDYMGTGKLKDKIAIITGGDSGIGRAVALAYAREGAHVAISYLAEEETDAQETIRVCEEAGVKTLKLPGDLSKQETCKMVIEETVNKFGHIDILVNNASFQGKQVNDISEISYDRLEFAFKTNIMAMLELAKLALPHMKPGGSIINPSSVVAYQPIPCILDYVCTKGAIVSFTKGLAQMVTPKNGIRVNCINPGSVWTPITVESFKKAFVAGFGGPQTPMQRAAQPKELSPSYVFLASKDATFINAKVLGMTGGLPIS